MRAQEFIIENIVYEMSGSVHGGIRKELKDKGYTYLGSGIDKHAFLEPNTGQVLLIFGTRKGYKGFNFTPDQKMFIDWVKYCQANANNPHLPRFSGLESFEYHGRPYLQCRMEPLHKVSGTIVDRIRYLADYIDEKRKLDVERVATRLGNKPVMTHIPNKNPKRIGIWREKTYKAQEIIDFLGGSQAATQLMQTIHAAKKIAAKNGYNMDLHKDNYMQRDDDTIVVNDPFVVWLVSNIDRFHE